MENSYEFKMSFKWEKIGHEVSANELWESIVALANIVNISTEKLYKENFSKNINLKVTGFEKWSFVTDFQLFFDPTFLGIISAWLPFAANTAPSPKDIIDFIKSTWEYFRFLKWKNAQEVKRLENWDYAVKNIFWESMQVTGNVYQASWDIIFQWETEKFMNWLWRSDIEKISLKDKNWEIFTVDKEEKESFEFDFTEEEKEQAEIYTEEHIITIIALSFEQNIQSRFRLWADKFSTYIEDEDFYRNMPRIKKWDKFKALLEITVLWNKKKFRVLKISELIKEPEQTQLI